MQGKPRTDEELLIAFRNILTDNPTISQNKYDLIPHTIDKPGRKNLVNRFGTWENAKKLAFEICGEKYEPNNTEGIEAPEELQEEYTQHSGVLTSKSRRITSLDEALKFFKVDLNIWEVDKYIVNQWEVGGKDAEKKIQVTPLYQVKVWLKKRTPKPLSIIINSLLEEVHNAAPIYPSLPIISTDLKERYMYEICIFDLHIAKLAWAQETGEDYDTKIAEARYTNAIAYLMGRTHGLNLELIELPTGNDFFHIDNAQNLTTAGTQQDVDSRWQRAFQKSIQLLVKTILSLASVAPVHVPIVPGNHDQQRMFYLGEALKQRFHGSDRITIDNSPNPRKYIKYGVNLIGYTHGKDEKQDSLPLIMATEQPKWWAETKHREFHIGHVHRKREFKYNAGDTYNGVSVRTIPSLCGTDAWHHTKGFVQSNRAAEAYLWEYNTGYAGHFSANIL